MKRILLLTFFLVSFTAAFAQEDIKSLDPKLIGSWKGSEKDLQYKDVEKHWVMHRFEDGSYLIMFTVVFYKEGRVESSAEKGTWWTENGKFFELHNGYDELPTVYSYRYIDDDHVKFNIADPGLAIFEDPNYNFIDIRIKEDNM